jgi:hypothetical protein
MTASLTTTHHADPSAYLDDHELVLAEPTDRPAIEWIRAIIEQSAVPWRFGLPPGWRVLGLQLASTHAPDHVHGWPVVVDRPEQVVLGARSRLGFQARLGVQVDGASVRFTTAIRYETRVARAIWSPIALPHRIIVDSMLRAAAARITP